MCVCVTFQIYDLLCFVFFLLISNCCTAFEVFYEFVLLCLGQGQITKLDCQLETLVDGK